MNAQPPITFGGAKPCALAQCDVDVADEAGVDHHLDAVVGSEIEVGAVDGEPDVGQLFVVLRHVQRVHRPGRFVEVGARRGSLPGTRGTSTIRRW